MSVSHDRHDPVHFFRLGADENTGLTQAALAAGVEPALIPPARVQQPAAIGHETEPAPAAAVPPAVASADIVPSSPLEPREATAPARDAGRAADATVSTAAANPRSEAGLSMHASLASQLLEVFMEEAIEMLDGLHASLEILEREPSAAAVIEARRTVHTLKGGARMCGLKPITDLAHACEDIIGPAMFRNSGLAAPMITLLFEAEQEIRAALNGPNIGPGSQESVLALTERLRAACQPVPAPPQAAVETALPLEDTADTRVPYDAVDTHGDVAVADTRMDVREADTQADAQEADTQANIAPAPADLAVAPAQAHAEAAPALEVPAAVARATAPPPQPQAQETTGPAPAPVPAPVPSGLAAQLLEVFVEEAAEMLDAFHASLETLERGPSEPAMIEARRTVHTIKGGARMCGRRAITELAHACEDIIGPIAAGNVSLAPEASSLLFAAEQEMRAALPQPNIGPGSDGSVLALAERLRAAKPQPAPAAAPPATAPLGGAAADVESGRAEPAPFSLTGKSMLMRRPTINTVTAPPIAWRLT